MRAPARVNQPGKRPGRASATAITPLSEVIHPGDPISLHDLLTLCAQYMPVDDLKLIYRAYKVAAAAHEGAKRQSGEAYIEHPLAVAAILAELAVDAQGIAAALLHDVVEDTSITREDVEAQFGAVIAHIVDGVTKFTAVEALDAPTTRSQTSDALTPIDVRSRREAKAHQQVETVRKLFGAMLDDPRVVLLKLADRLHNLRTMDVMLPHKREIKARETIDIYAPLAGRIGLYLFKVELEDFAFKYLYPQDFERVSHRLSELEASRGEWAERMCDTIKQRLATVGISAAVNWRMKRPYSAFLDSQQSQLDIGALDDVIAFRVLVNSVEECYLSLNVIYQLWRHYHDSFRDYIAMPKVNGYQSLHTSVFGVDGRLAQLHIRTHRMHVAVQHGVATQWLEAALKREPGSVDPTQWLKRTASWVGRIANWNNELNLTASEFVDTVRGEMFADQVFVFTPKGDVRELPAGATALDLAYRIHTGLGDTATGAWVQTTNRDDEPVGVEAPLSYTLRNGDVVRILRDANSRPRPEWLDIAHTRYALDRIRRSLGRMRRSGELREPVSGAPNDEPTAETEPEQPELLRHPTGRPADVQLARCCCPIPGDAIVGLPGRGRLVTIHRSGCRTLSATVARRRELSAPYAEPVPLSWAQLPQTDYVLCVNIYGQDHQGLIHQLTIWLAEHRISILRSSAAANQDRAKAAIAMMLLVPGARRADDVMRRLRRSPGVTEVERDRRRGCDGGMA
ncbi:MAG TPA: HD domain-containing protein [Ktedonobacterales bacterium]|jgi:GTP pyrophosphokinase|nr:HD domain-containing protein [Ktedonobacterales bacterium]